MNKILQMLELVLQAEEREPGRFKVEISENRMYVYDFHKHKATNSSGIMPATYTYSPEPTTGYQSWSNEMFGYFINDLDKTPFLNKMIMTQNEYEGGKITLNTARQRFGLDPLSDDGYVVKLEEAKK